MKHDYQGAAEILEEMSKGGFEHSLYTHGVFFDSLVAAVKLAGEVQNCPFRDEDIKRGFLLFRHGQNGVNFCHIPCLTDALPESEKESLVTMMINVAHDIHPKAAEIHAERMAKCSAQQGQIAIDPGAR